jgi:hypothetical protein
MFSGVATAVRVVVGVARSLPFHREESPLTGNTLEGVDAAIGEPET